MLNHAKSFFFLWSNFPFFLSIQPSSLTFIFLSFPSNFLKMPFSSPPYRPNLLFSSLLPSHPYFNSSLSSPPTSFLYTLCTIFPLLLVRLLSFTSSVLSIFFLASPFSFHTLSSFCLLPFNPFFLSHSQFYLSSSLQALFPFTPSVLYYLSSRPSSSFYIIISIFTLPPFYPLPSSQRPLLTFLPYSYPSFFPLNPHFTFTLHLFASQPQFPVCFPFFSAPF